MSAYLVAETLGDTTAHPEIVFTRDTGSTVIPGAAAALYSRKKPGMMLAVWMLGNFPTRFAVDQTGEGVHELARGNALKAHHTSDY